MFWHVIEDLQNARLSDTNKWLMNAWEYVLTSPGMVSVQYNTLLNRYNGMKNRDDFYVKFRDGYINTTLSPIGTKDAAAFFLFIASCFNGIWRERNDGGVNSPKGSGYPKEIKLHYYQKHADAAEKLNSLQLKCQSFLTDTRVNKEGDVYFIDPPYLGQYNGYGANKFKEDSHLALKKKIEELADHGCRVVMTASDTPETHNLYGEPDVFLEVNRTIAADKKARKVLNEVVYIYGPE